MARRSDIGSYFDKLTRRGRGGTRHDAGLGESGDDADSPGPTDAAPADAAPAPSDSSDAATPDTGSPRRPGGVGGFLRDMVSKGSKAATTAAKSTSTKVRDTAQKLPGRSRSSDSLPSEGVVTIEYSPREDGDPDPGEVVWAWVPFAEDPSQGKDRPMVIIGRRGTKLVGIPLTTKANDREAQLKIGTGGWDPKRRVSYARIWRLVDIDPAAARREGSMLDERRFEQLVTMVERYYDVNDGRGSSGWGDDAWNG